MKAQELMTTNPVCCTASDTAADVARLMADNDCGCIPVVSDESSRRVEGVVTDRDIALRGVARGKGPSTQVRELMSSDVSCCGPESEIEEVESIMAERQVRRVPVVDESGCCMGMIAQADLAREEGRRVDPQEVAEVVDRISRPINDPRTER